MSTETIVEQAVKSHRVRQAKAPGGMDLGKDQSREAKQLAAAILEVLAGEEYRIEWDSKLRGVDAQKLDEILKRTARPC
jgi:hypothetical protein